MTSYLPVGIPISQDPSTKHPYSQNFPDEPDSGSLNIQLPSTDNNKESHPHYDHNRQQPIQLAHPVQSHAPDELYNQLSQLVVIGTPVQVDSEIQILKKRIKDIENRLDNGCYYAYLVYLYLNMGCCHFAGISSFVALFYAEQRNIETICWMGVFLSWCIWLAQQCLVMKNAIKDKNLEAARRGYRSMIGYSMYYLFTFTVLLLALRASLRERYQYERFENEGLKTLSVFIIMYAIPTFLKLFGAIKVISLLEKRRGLIYEFNQEVLAWRNQEVGSV